MGNLLYGVDAKVGDIWLIKAGLIHAIGEGCTIIEVQEPTDFTIQPERWCDNYHISPQEEFIGLDKSVALDAINFEIYGEASVKFAKVEPKVVHNSKNLIKEELISYKDTPCFAENRYTLNNGEMVLSFAPSVYIVLEGEGEIIGENYTKKIKKGDYFFLPRVAENSFRIKSLEKMVVVECLPSKQQ